MLKYDGQKKVILIFFTYILSIFFLSISAETQNKVDVFIRFSEQDNSYRIVIETRDDLINTAKVNVLDTEISIVFVDLIKPVYTKKIPYEINHEDKRLVIKLKQKTDVKSFVLKEPPRLVFDIKKTEAKVDQGIDTVEKTKPHDFKSEEKRLQPHRLSETKVFQLTSKLFVIDPGHGGYEFGVTSNSYIEKNITLTLAKDIERRLKKAGKSVFLVRRVDQYMPISERIEFVNQKKTDIFLSLHISTDNKFIFYVPKFEEIGSEEVIDFYNLSMRQKKYIERSKALAEALSKVFKETFKSSVEKKELPIPLLKSIKAPCVMIEFPSPKYLIYDEKTRDEIVEAILKGLVIFEQ